MKKYIYLMAIGMFACKPDITTEPDSVEQVSVLNISTDDNILKVDDELTLKANLIKGQDTTFDVLGDWTSSDSTIGVILNANTLTIKTEGVFKIYVSYQNLTDSLTINAVAKESIAKRININATDLEIGVNGTSSFSLEILDEDDNSLELTETQWFVKDSTKGVINAEGVFTATKSGVSIIYAESNGLTSDNVSISVFSGGTFVGKEGHSASGDVRLLYRNNQLIIETQDNFSVQGGPDLRVFLSNIENGSRINSEALELALLSSNSGKGTYIVGGDVDISDYEYINIHCKQYNTTFGSAKLN